MSKISKILIAAFMACLMACVSFAAIGCSKNGSDNPPYRNPSSTPIVTPPDDEDAYDGRYIISVLTEGGLSLDGVFIAAVQNGQVAMEGISRNGIIEFVLPQGEYKLQVDASSLPAGYYVPDYADYKTTPELAGAKVVISSTVISSTAPSGTRYEIGDIMYDFSFVETNGTRYTLSEILSTRRAVMLNFWYTTCNPCRSEFPVIQKAYEAYADKIGIIALSNSDSMSDITAFKQDFGLTFHMGPDQTGVTSMFGVSQFPTTVIIDRYGTVVFKDSGSIPLESTWKAIFGKYTADEYTQTPDTPDNPDNPDELPTERAKPDDSLKMPASSALIEAIGGTGSEKITSIYPETNEKDAPYSFPWLIGKDDSGESYVYPSNSKTEFSYAIMYCDLSLKSGDIVSYEYDLDTETNCDIVYVQINRKRPVAQYSGKSEGRTREYAVYYADRDVDITLSFVYMKDQLNSIGDDMIKLRNLTVTNIADEEGAYDRRVSAIDGLTLNKDGNYDLDLVEPFSENNDTQYYKVNVTDGNGNAAQAYLLTKVIDNTVWTDMHVGTETFDTFSGSAAVTSLYALSYWQMSNVSPDKPQNEQVLLNYGDPATTTAFVFEHYYLNSFSDNGFLPVTQQMRETIEAFTKKYCADNKLEYYDGQWLEFCYYYLHYNEKHLGDELCGMDELNPILGLSWKYAIELESGNTVNEYVNITKAYTGSGDSQGGGLWYKFVPSSTGVYYFYSTLTSDDDKSDPSLAVYDESGNIITIADNDMRYNHFNNPHYENFYEYVELEAGKVYRVQATMSVPGDMGSYYLHIEYDSQSRDVLRVCSTGDGTWESISKYNAIPVALNNSEGCYYELTADYDYGSKIYIDFVNPNYFEKSGKSLYDMIVGGMFNFSDNGGRNHTNTMLQYYRKSIEGKYMGSELYGITEATEELAIMLSDLIYYAYGDGDGLASGGWLMFASYYVHYGV